MTTSDAELVELARDGWWAVLLIVVACCIFVVLFCGDEREPGPVESDIDQKRKDDDMTERDTYQQQLAIARAAYDASVQLGDHASAQLNAESMAAAHRRLALLDEQERKQRESKEVV